MSHDVEGVFGGDECDFLVHSVDHAAFLGPVSWRPTTVK